MFLTTKSTRNKLRTSLGCRSTRNAKSYIRAPCICDLSNLNRVSNNCALYGCISARIAVYVCSHEGSSGDVTTSSTTKMPMFERCTSTILHKIQNYSSKRKHDNFTVKTIHNVIRSLPPDVIPIEGWSATFAACKCPSTFATIPTGANTTATDDRRGGEAAFLRSRR